MICPNCQSGDVVVRASRLTHGVRQRGRGCRACNARWFTREVMVEGTLDVPKPEPEWWSRARALKRLGWRQVTIAEMLGVSQGMVARVLKPAMRARINAGKTYDSEVHNIKRRARQEARA